MLVIIIIGILAGFSLPNFGKTARRSRARNAIVNLSMIHAANVLYKARTGSNISGTANLAAVNAALNLNIVDPKSTYACTSGTTCTATSTTGGPDYTVTVTLATDLADATNPSCATSNSSCPL